MIVNGAPMNRSTASQGLPIETWNRYGLLVHDPGEIARRLAAADMDGFLERLLASARAAFPVPAELSIEPQVDPEESPDGVVLYLRLAQYPEDVLERIDRAMELASMHGANPAPWRVLF